MRHWIICLLTIAVLSGALTGCGSSSKDEPPKIKDVPTGRFRKKPAD